MQNYDWYQYIRTFPQCGDLNWNDYLTEDEAEWLYWCLNRPEVNVFLKLEEIQDLKQRLLTIYGQKISAEPSIKMMGKSSLHVWSEKEVYTARKLLDAIKKHRIVRFTNQTISAGDIDGCGIPLYIEVDNLNNCWYVLFYEVEKEIMVYARVDRLVKLMPDDVCDEKLYEKARNRSEEEQKCVEIKLKNRYNTLQRACAVFSQYKRYLRYDREQDVLYMKILYHEFDEKDIKRELLSLNAQVKVIAPREMQEFIKGEYVKMLGA